MEDFVTLVKQGVIYDGCPIVAKGTVRINGNDISIESMHNLMAVDGKSFADLCDAPSRTQQGQYLEKDLEALESWKSKADKLAQEKDLLATGLNKTISALQQKIEQEYQKRATIEEHLDLERRISEETTLALGQVKSTLSSKSEQVEKLQGALEQKDSELDELRDQLDRAEKMLLEREQKLETLEQDRIERENNLLLKRNQAETLQTKLDSASMILEEKDEKLQTLQSELGKKSESVKDATIETQELKEHVALLESERLEDKKSSAVMVDEFSQWRSVSEEELANLKKELEQSKSTISTLKNELEVFELEGHEYNESLANLQKENQLLREQLELTKADETKSQEPEKLNRKQRSQSFKNLLRSVSKPKDKDATKEPKENKDKERKHRFSLASNPSA